MSGGAATPTSISAGAGGISGHMNMLEVIVQALWWKDQPIKNLRWQFNIISERTLSNNIKMPESLISLMCKLCDKVFHAVTVDHMRRHFEIFHRRVTYDEFHLDFLCTICLEPERWCQCRYDNYQIFIHSTPLLRFEDVDELLEHIREHHQASKKGKGQCNVVTTAVRFSQISPLSVFLSCADSLEKSSSIPKKLHLFFRIMKISECVVPPRI